MRRLKSVIASVALAGSLSSLQVAAQMNGGRMAGPPDGMTNGAEDLIIPAGIRGPGQAGSLFVTDLWIKSGVSGVVTLYYHAVDSSSSQPAATATVVLDRPITYLPDVIQGVFGLSSAFGALRVVASFPVSATERVYNQNGVGAYGLALAGMPGRTGVTSMPMSGVHGVDDYAIYMVGLLPEPGNRVNVNVVSTSADGASGMMEILDADGSTPDGAGAKSFRFSIAGYSSHQFNGILANVRSKFPNGDASLQVRVRMNQGVQGSVVAYAVVNDNVTNDGYLVMGSMMNGGLGMGGGVSTVLGGRTSQ